MDKEFIKLRAARIPTSEYSETFLQGMINRMGTSHHKYGFIASSVEVIDMQACLEERLQKYRETGNTEWLMDVANYAMIEFMHPQHPEAHYRPTDTKESPGRVTHTGRRTRKHDLDIKRP